MIHFSIIVPYYNRRDHLTRSLNSIMRFDDLGNPLQVILVDDGSTDDSRKIVEKFIENQPRHSNIKFISVSNCQNQGVAHARNRGIELAVGKWIILLDSDDELIPNTLSLVLQALLQNDKIPIHFFKCLAEGERTKASFENLIKVIDFNQLLFLGTGGEALPIIRTSVIKEHLFEESINGYEGLVYLRIIRKYKHATLNSLPVRVYYTKHSDRLSSTYAMRLRYGDIARGHLMVLVEHYDVMSIRSLCKQSLRFLKALFMTALFKVV